MSLRLRFSARKFSRVPAPNDRIAIQKLPSVEFSGKDHQIVHGVSPDLVLVRFEYRALAAPGTDVSDGKRRRSGNHCSAGDDCIQLQGLFPCAEHDPSSAALWRFDHAEQTLSALNIFRKSGEVNVDFITPTLERVFPAPKWLGSKLKHVIEPRHRTNM